MNICDSICQGLEWLQFFGDLVILINDYLQFVKKSILGVEIYLLSLGIKVILSFVAIANFVLTKKFSEPSNLAIDHFATCHMDFFQIFFFSERNHKNPSPYLLNPR